MRLIGNKTHGDLAEIGMAEFINQFMYDFKSIHVGKDLFRAKKILKKINYPIILKFPSGTGGKGVMYAESFAAASSMLDALETLRQPFLIQEYVDHQNQLQQT